MLAPEIFTMESLEAKHVEFVVGGLRYTVAIADIQNYPESFFAAVVKKEWQHAAGEPIKIDRDGELFKYIYAYLVYGHLPCKQDGTVALDPKIVELVKEEADFYNLPALVDECDRNTLPVDVFTRVAAYKTIRSYIRTAKHSFSYRTTSVPTLTLKYDSADRDDLVNLLASAWKPFCVKGRFSEYEYGLDEPLFESSTAANLNIEELLARAKQSAFGKGTETVIDTTVRDSFEIAAEHLNSDTLMLIEQGADLDCLTSSRELELRPYKLVIYQEGGHFDQHRDTVRGDNHIGTLVVILNSAYTGGELEISHGGQTEEVTGPYSWVAMYGDCLHKINPVTSGTRVSLIYDIYAASAEQQDGRWKGYEGYDKLGYFFSSRRHEHYGRIHSWKTSREVDVASCIRKPQQQLICAALDKELDTYGTVVICLAHLYPACQSNPSFLKGGDLALYELLRDKYQVSVEAVSVYMTRNDEDCSATKVVAAMYNDVEEEANTTYGQRQAHGGPAAKKAKTDSSADQVLFVIPAHLSHEHVLDYSPFIEHTGNESQNEETVYLVAGLQVRKL